MSRCVVLALLGAFVFSGCGGGGYSPAAEATTAAPTTTVEKCKGAKSATVRARKTRKLRREIEHIRTLAEPIERRTLNGTPALSRAVDRFLVGVRDRDVPVRTRSRLIDHAAAIVAPVCEQCFQALEANRPIAGGAKLGCG